MLLVEMDEFLTDSISEMRLVEHLNGLLQQVITFPLPSVSRIVKRVWNYALVAYVLSRSFPHLDATGPHECKIMGVLHQDSWQKTHWWAQPCCWSSWWKKGMMLPLWFLSRTHPAFTNLLSKHPGGRNGWKYWKQSCLSFLYLLLSSFSV